MASPPAEKSKAYNSRLSRARAANVKSGRISLLKPNLTDDEDDGDDKKKDEEAELSSRTEDLAVSPASVSSPATDGGQKFAVGSYVYCKRSNGSESISTVLDYKEGWYMVEMEAINSGLKKKIKEEALREAPPGEVPPEASAAILHVPKFAVGERVYVKRSNGSEGIAFVESFDAKKGIYLLELDAAGSAKHKRAYENTLRAAPAEEGESVEATSDMI